MATKRKPASKTKVDRLRQTTKPARVEMPLEKAAIKPPPVAPSAMADQTPGRILSMHFGAESEGQPLEVVADQPAAKKPWHRRLYDFLFAG